MGWDYDAVMRAWYEERIAELRRQVEGVERQLGRRADDYHTGAER